MDTRQQRNEERLRMLRALRAAADHAHELVDIVSTAGSPTEAEVAVARLLRVPISDVQTVLHFGLLRWCVPASRTQLDDEIALLEKARLGPLAR